MFSPSSIADFLACPHLTALNRQYKEGAIKKPFFDDPGWDLLIRLGLEHEQKYLNELMASGRNVVEIPTDKSWAQTAMATRAAMAAGADVIYQATFVSEVGEQRPEIGGQRAEIGDRPVQRDLFGRETEMSELFAPDGAQCGRDDREIGRASCRERVWISVRCGSL